MMNLLQIEWMKLRKYATFWILCSLFSGLFLLSVYGQSKSFVKLGGGPVDILSGSYSFPNVWDNVAFTYSWFVIFLSVFMIISVSNEFTFRTGRQHIIDGMKRLEFLHGKLLLGLSLSIMATLLFILTSLLFGFINGGGNPIPHSEKIAYVFLFTINYLTFAILLTFFIRRAGLGIILFLAYLVVEFLMMQFINWKFSTSVGSLLPLQASDELLPNPLMRTLGNATGMQSAPVMYCIGMSLFYLSAYYFILQRKLLKSDL
jgi:ABC-2 type transport system permease protein